MTDQFLKNTLSKSIKDLQIFNIDANLNQNSTGKLENLTNKDRLKYFKINVPICTSDLKLYGKKVTNLKKKDSDVEKGKVARSKTVGNVYQDSK